MPPKGQRRKGKAHETSAALADGHFEDLEKTPEPLTVARTGNSCGICWCEVTPASRVGIPDGAKSTVYFCSMHGDVYIIAFGHIQVSKYVKDYHSTDSFKLTVDGAARIRSGAVPSYTPGDAYKEDGVKVSVKRKAMLANATEFRRGLEANANQSNTGGLYSAMLDMPGGGASEKVWLIKWDARKQHLRSISFSSYKLDRSRIRLMEPGKHLYDDQPLDLIASQFSDDTESMGLEHMQNELLSYEEIADSMPNKKQKAGNQPAGSTPAASKPALSAQDADKTPRIVVRSPNVAMHGVSCITPPTRKSAGCESTGLENNSCNAVGSAMLSGHEASTDSTESGDPENTSVPEPHTHRKTVPTLPDQRRRLLCERCPTPAK